MRNALIPQLREDKDMDNYFKKHIRSELEWKIPEPENFNKNSLIFLIEKSLVQINKESKYLLDW